MTPLDPNLPVGQIAVEFSEAIPVLEKYRIDYYSQGSRTLKDACYLANAPLEEVVTALEKLHPASGEWYKEERDWREESMAALVQYILRVHHPYARAQMDRIETMLEQIETMEGNPDPPMVEVRDLFQRMANDFREHLLEEEEVVFPYLLQVEEALRKMEPLPRTFEGYSQQTHPLRHLLSDHGMMGLEWRRIEELTHHFQPSRGASPRVKELFEALREFDRDNRKHVHLENNILFYRAIRMGLLDEGGGHRAIPKKISL